MKHDIVIRQGRVIDPARGIDAVTDVALSEGRIVAAGSVVPDRVIDAGGCLVLPGLIDFHCHVFYRGSLDGVPPDAAMLPQGVTTVVDGGTPGIANYDLFYRSVVVNSVVRVKCYLNVASTGIITGKLDENLDPGRFAPDQIARVFDHYKGEVLGLKIRISKELVGSLGIAPLEATLNIAKAVGCPITVHTTNPPIPTEELVALFRPGDVFSHCFHGKGSTIVGTDGKVLPAVRAARQRGVLFDAANGRNHFAYKTARPALDEGFFPDIISSDLSELTMYRPPVFGLPHLMSKYAAMGMPLAEIIAACTSSPARHMGMLGEIGTLAPGACADVAIFKLVEGPVEFGDSEGELLAGSRFLVPQATIRGGQVVYWHAGF
jgi:predicted amidohydrolase